MENQVFLSYNTYRRTNSNKSNIFLQYTIYYSINNIEATKFLFDGLIGIYLIIINDIHITFDNNF